MRKGDFASDILNRLIEREAGFDRDDHEIEGIRESESETLVSSGDQVIEKEARAEIAEKTGGDGNHDAQDRIRSNEAAEQDGQRDERNASDHADTEVNG